MGLSLNDPSLRTIWHDKPPGDAFELGEQPCEVMNGRESGSFRNQLDGIMGLLQQKLSCPDPFGANHGRKGFMDAARKQAGQLPLRHVEVCRHFRQG